MTDYGTIKIPREEYAEHNDLRKQLGLTWSEYLNGQTPEHKLVDYAHIRDIVREEIESATRR